MNSQQLSVIRRQAVVIGVIMGVMVLSGCGGLRFAATEAQKENAWLHQRVCATAAGMARDEDGSEALCGLTQLAHDQSGAFVTDYGLPEVMPEMSDAQSAAVHAKVDAAKRPDVWTLADSAMELGIALAGLVGGVYGVRAAGFLKTAREKSTALKEIIAGNELFKQLYPEQSDRFKEAQRKQSPATQQLVTGLKMG